ncbi:MAG: hypothetical protein MZW92_69050 [Comamonadaceae bacterium]|nr:hypothetical protein [Comamonadaceae bacterium]
MVRGERRERARPANRLTALLIEDRVHSRLANRRGRRRHDRIVRLYSAAQQTAPHGRRAAPQRDRRDAPRMPELPEVETTRRGIAPHVDGPADRRRSWSDDRGCAGRFRRGCRARLRRPAASTRSSGAASTCCCACGAAARCSSHLGMSGSLRVSAARRAAPGRTTTSTSCLDDGRVLRCHDPRRFGAMLWLPRRRRRRTRCSARLGPEPFDPGFDAATCTASHARPARGDQAAADGQPTSSSASATSTPRRALFRAGIRPAHAAPAGCRGARLRAAGRRGARGARRGDRARAAARCATSSAPTARRATSSSTTSCTAARASRAASAATPIRRIAPGQRVTCFCPRLPALLTRGARRRRRHVPMRCRRGTARARDGMLDSPCRSAAAQRPQLHMARTRRRASRPTATGADALAARVVGTARLAARAGPRRRAGRPARSQQLARAPARGQAGRRLRRRVLARQVRAHQRDLLRRLRPAASCPRRPGRTTMCPTELLYDAVAAAVASALLPIETRARQDATVASSRATRTSGRRFRSTWRRAERHDRRASRVVATVKRVPVAEARSATACPMRTIGRGAAARRRATAWSRFPAGATRSSTSRTRCCKQGLVILDTPGLNAIGTEPELTLSLLPQRARGAVRPRRRRRRHARPTSTCGPAPRRRGRGGSGAATSSC